MNSVQQTILGLVLVGIAFVFGSYLHRDSESQVADNQTADMENIAWQGESNQEKQTPFSQNATTLNSPQSSMPRLQPSKLVEANLIQDLDESIPAEAETADEFRSLEIVEPDFSQFAFNDSETATEVARIGAAPQVATPKFESYFPEQASNDVEGIEPKMPRRDINSNSQDSELGQTMTVVQRRLSFDNLESSYQAPPNPNQLRSGNSSGQAPARVRRMTPIQTQTTVTSIRPRTNSPIMMDATEFLDHETVRGDTLQQLAVKYFGDAAYYLDIYVANKNVLQDPADVPAGIRLRIPVYK